MPERPTKPSANIGPIPLPEPKLLLSPVEADPKLRFGEIVPCGVAAGPSLGRADDRLLGLFLASTTVRQRAEHDRVDA